MLQFRKTVLSVAAAALAAGMALASPAFAADTTQAPVKKVATRPGNVEPRTQAGVEGRIADLRVKFGITEAQKPQWEAFAQVMRDNAKSYDVTVKVRVEKMKSMNAVEDLRSFQELAQAHADGLKKLTNSFKDVYDSMTPEQKKNADTVFHTYAQRTAHHHHGAKAKKAS